MSVSQARQKLITLEQYENLPDNIRAEVFDGQIYYTASPSQIHQTILTELLVSIRSYLRKKDDNC
jgi:Uma2 family endonuclease